MYVNKRSSKHYILVRAGATKQRQYVCVSAALIMNNGTANMMDALWFISVHVIETMVPILVIEFNVKD